MSFFICEECQISFFAFGVSWRLISEVVLHGTIRLDSKIRSENVHFHDSFWREQTLAATKLFLTLTRVDFAAAVSSRAVRISSRAVRVITSTRTALIRDLFSYGFPRKLRAGRTGHMIKHFTGLFGRNRLVSRSRFTTEFHSGSDYCHKRFISN